MDLMQIKIAKDEQIVSYIKFIREYDGRIISLEFFDNWLNSMDEIKKEVENDIDREVYEC